MRSQPATPDLTLGTDILSGFNPEAMAKSYIQAREYTRLGQQEAAINSKTDLNLALYVKFGLISITAQGVAIHEIEAWSETDDQLKLAEYYAAHSLLNDSTSLHYSAQSASQLDFEINDGHLDIAKSRASHSQLLTLMFGLPQITPELERLSLVYFQGRRRAAAAFAMRDVYPRESAQRQLLAAQSFTEYYQRLGKLTDIKAIDSAGDQVSLDR